MDQAWRLIREDLIAGRPTIGFNVHGQWNYDLIIGFDQEECRVFYQNWKSGYVKSLAELERNPAWHVTSLRSFGPRYDSRTLEFDGIVEMVLRPRHPVIEGGCGSLGGRAENAVGLAAYALWAERVLSKDHSRDFMKGLRIAWWIDHRRLGVQFLREIAPNHDSVTAKHLDLASDILQRELEDALLPLQETCPISAADEHRERQKDPQIKSRQSSLMHRAALIQREFIKALEPVAFRHLGLVGESAQIVALDFDGVLNPPRVALLNRMFLSTDTRVRTLAATAAINSRSDRLVPELKRALLDPDEQLAHAALAVLRSLRPHGLSEILWQAYEQSPLSRKTDSAPDDLRRQIVFAAADIGDRASLELLDAAFHCRDHDDPALARWAAESLARLDALEMDRKAMDGLQSANANIARASIAAVKLLHATRARQHLERLAISNHPDVRADAVEALESLSAS